VRIEGTDKMDIINTLVSLFTALLNAVGIVIFAIILGFIIAGVIGIITLGVIKVKNRLQKK
jgi:hypothetical protein